MKPTLLILAAGMGSRYGGLKQIDPIGPAGETIIDYSIYDAIRAGFGKVVFVVKESIENEFKEIFVARLQDRIQVDYVFQEIWMVPEGITIPENRNKPWGTGHAVLMAEGRIDGPFAVINSDDFYGRGAFEAMAAHYRDWTPERKNDYCMVGYRVGKTLSEFGSVSRGVCQVSGSILEDVVERTQIERLPSGIAYKSESGEYTGLGEDTLVSMNFWGFTPSFFGYLSRGFEAFIHENSGNPKAEFFIPGMVNELIKKKEAAVTMLNCDEKWFGMTYKEDRPKVVASIRELIHRGVYPENLWR